MSIARLMQQAAAGAAGGELLAIEDVFSTYLYTGNGSTQTITNGIDLAGEGGLVWIKNRDQTDSHILTDTERSATETLVSNTTAAEATDADTLTAFNADGFDLGADVKVNTSTENYVSWTFRKAPRFFDVVTYTGTGSARTVSHNLGVVPGCIIVKRTDSTGDWIVYHRSNTANPETDYLELNDTAATADDNTMWNDTAPTSTEFTVGTDADVNGNTNTYVAYLFAHDPLGPSGDGSDGLIACGSYTGNGSLTGPVVDLGWEPQWLLIKEAGPTTGRWILLDTMRGLSVGASGAGVSKALYAHVSDAEVTDDLLNINPRGFQILNAGGDINTSGSTYIYIAIRRGPMRQPTSGTEVFSPQTAAGVQTTGFVVDASIGVNSRAGPAGYDPYTRSRLMGGAPYLTTSSTAAQANGSNMGFDSNTGVTLSWPSGTINWYFRRAPGFFDVVAYTGDGVAGRTVPHNLGVAPEMIIVKRRNTAANWVVGSAAGPGWGNVYILNSTGGASNTGEFTPAPTDAVFSVSDSGGVNGSADTYIAYLFATLPGVSKVFSVTKSSGSAASVDCGFTAGPRFVLLKRTDSTGDWYVWDTARGIVAGDDPYLLLNSTAAEVTNTDYIDPTSNGFTIVDGGLANGAYIGLAIS